MHLAGVARLDQQAALGARALAHQVMVHAGGGQQAGDRRVRRRRRRDPRGSGCRSRPPPPGWPCGTARPSPARAPARPRRGCRAAAAWSSGTASPVGRWRSFATWSLWRIGYSILICRQASGVGLEQVALGADGRGHRRDQLFADGVERRVGDLGEELREVVVEQPRPIRQHRQRGVDAHRADRLLAGQRHRREQQPQVLLGVAERLLPPQHRLVIGPLGVGAGQILDVDQVLAQPVGVRAAAAASSRLISSSPTMRPGGGVDRAASCRAAADPCSTIRSGGMSSTPTSDAMITQVVGGDAVARRPQAVAIEHRADQRAVGEGDRRRAVPRLHQRRVVLVERPHRRIHRRVAGPRLRDHHQHRVRQRSARPSPGTRARCRTSRCRCRPGGSPAAPCAGRRRARVDCSRPSRARIQLTLPLQRVDLAVVGDVAVRVRERPRRERVGREALVHQRQRRLERRGRTGRGTSARAARPSACPCRSASAPTG